MNWLEARDILIPKSSDFRNFGHSDKISRQERMKILSNNNFSCRYCGGVYQKYLLCCYIPDKKCNDVCCRLCYLITHLNYGMFREMKLYYSKMSQLEINKLTVNYIIENNETPVPTTIDENIKLPGLSLLEYINILNNYDVLPEELKDYKIFFTNKLGIEFVLRNYGQTLFFNNNKTSDLVDTDKMKLDDTLDKHELSSELLKLLEKQFS